MKNSYYSLILAFLIPTTGFCQLMIKSRSDREEKVTKKVIQEVKVKQAKQQVLPNSDFQKIDLFLNNASNLPAIWDFTRTFHVKSTTVLRGRLLNSVKSTNLGSPLIIQLTDNSSDLPMNTVFQCTGATVGKCVETKCHKIILPDKLGDEVPVTVTILNSDGSSCLKADHFYTGKEEMLIGTVGSAALRGVIEAQQTRVPTPVGELTPNTVKNRYLNGVISSADEGTSLMRQEMRSRVPVAVINAGREVMIYFTERLSI